MWYCTHALLAVCTLLFLGWGSQQLREREFRGRATINRGTNFRFAGAKLVPLTSLVVSYIFCAPRGFPGRFEPAPRVGPLDGTSGWEVEIGQAPHPVIAHQSSKGAPPAAAPPLSVPRPGLESPMPRLGHVHTGLAFLQVGTGGKAWAGGCVQHACRMQAAGTADCKRVTSCLPIPPASKRPGNVCSLSDTSLQAQNEGCIL